MTATRAAGRRKAKPDNRDDDVVPPLDLRMVPAALAAWSGCLIALWLGAPVAFLTGAVAAVGAVAALLTRNRRWRRGLLVGLFCLAAGSGMCAARMTIANSSPVYHAAERGAYADIVMDIGTDPTPLVSRGRATGTRYLVHGTLVTAALGGQRWTVNLAVSAFCDAPGWAIVIPGQRISTRGKLGIDAFERWPTISVNCNRAPGLVSAEPWWQRFSSHLRSTFVAVADGLDGDAAGLLPGLVLGDRTGIPPALTQDAKVTGLTHLLAVSGSHFAVLCGALLVVLRRAGPRIAAAGGLLFSIALVIVVRPGPSVLRAAVMGGLTLAALLLGRSRSMLPALAVAVIVLLFWEPALAVEPGFALSVQATAVIILVAPHWSEALQRRGWPAGWADLVAVPAVAQLGTMPVIAAISGTVSVWALPVNIMVVPAVTAALVLGALSALLSVWWTGGATLLAQLAAPAADWIAFCAHWVASWPAATLSWPTSTSGVLALAGLSITVPLALRSRKIRALSIAVVAGIAVVLIPTQALAPGWPPPDWLAIGCEVGQGDGFVIATGIPGSAIVVDTGPEASVMDRCLTRLGVQAVPIIVLTHLHADHINGLLGVMRDRAVGQVGVGPGRDPAPAWGQVLDTAANAGVPVVSLRLGAQMVIGQLGLTVLGPDPRRVSRVLGPNDQSVVLLIEVSGFRMIFAGDIQEAGQQALLDSGQVLQADVLKLPHHGSAKLLPAFMAAVHPSVVMIGVGVGNDFGHPTEYALHLVESVGVQVILRTDRDGDIGVTRIDGVLGTATRGAAAIQPRRGRRFRKRGNWPVRPALRRAHARVDRLFAGLAGGARSVPARPRAPPRDCRGQ